MNTVDVPAGRVYALWRPTRYILGASFGVVVLIMSFVVQHRESFTFDDPSRSGCTSCGDEVPHIPLSAAQLPAEQFMHALFDENWLKVERYLAPVSSDREYLENFRILPDVKMITQSDCTSKDIREVSVTPPVQDSTVFYGVTQMTRLCVTPDGRSFNRVAFQVYPIAEEWYYVAATLRLESPRSR